MHLDSIKIKDTRNHIDWYIAVKKMVNEPNLRNDLAEQLHEDIKVKHHIDTVNTVRKQLFDNLCK